MKKILLILSGLLIGFIAYAQDSLSMSSSDSPPNAHAELLENKQNKATKALGDSAYMNNNYSTAIQIYESLLKEGEAAEVYYNLGNSYYKSDNIARAILNYERALLLQPGNEDIRVNLEIARSKTVDKVDIIPDIFFISWIKSLINSMNIDIWAKLGIIFFILFITSLYFFFFSKQILQKKIGFICGIVFLLFTISTNIFASYQKNILLNHNTAIVISPNITVHSTPNESGTSLFVLHEGRKVVIKDNSMKEWKEISLEDGKVGWVATSDIEII